MGKEPRVLFDDWNDLWRVIAVGVPAYAALVFLLRVSGKRTLSKMNAFDFVVTVAIGSTLATVLLSQEVSLAEGALALALLIGLQYLMTWLSVRSAVVDRILKSDPVLLYHRGEFLDRAMKLERVTRDELLAAVRSQGIASLGQVAAVILETDGTFSVLKPADETADQAPLDVVSR